MNWKASLLGAVLVAISGLVVGAAIGGRKTTRVITVTAPAPVAATTPATQATSTTTTSGVTTEEAGENTSSTETSSTADESPAESGGTQEYLAEYLAAQNSEQLGKDASDVSLSQEASKQELQGQTYQQAVAFNIDGYSSTASFQMPTPGFSRLTSKAAGLEINSSAETDYKLTVYKNNDGSPGSVVLYHSSFHGPSEVHKMDFALQGATDLLFVWTRQGAEQSDSQDIFILAEPVLAR